MKRTLGWSARAAVVAGLGAALMLGGAPGVAAAAAEDAWCCAEAPVLTLDAVAPVVDGVGVAVLSESARAASPLIGDGSPGNPFLVGSGQQLNSALARGGQIKLLHDITGTNTADSFALAIVNSGVTCTIDLMGHRIAATDGVGYVIYNQGNLAITDSEGGGSVSGGSMTLVNRGELDLRGVAVSNPYNVGVFNLGGLDVDGCTLTGANPLYITGKNGEAAVAGVVRADVVNSTISAQVTGGATYYGIVVLGKGTDEAGAVANDGVRVNLTGCTVSSNVGGQGIATVSAGDAYAGFTLNVSSSTIDMGAGSTGGCGCYLASSGVTTISGSRISAAQGVRIATGELAITNGTAITSACADDEGLVPGHSGGPAGALVVGKAGAGYTGDIAVTVDASSTLSNTARAAEGAVSAAVVVSDRDMASAEYAGDAIDVELAGRVAGDVVKTSTVAGGAVETDGGTVGLTLARATVTGDVVNRSSTGIEVEQADIAGDVTLVAGARGSIGIVASTVGGTLRNEGSGGATSMSVVDSSVGAVADRDDVLLVNTSVAGGEPETSTGIAGVEATVAGKVYPAVQDAVDAAQVGERVYIIQNIALDDAIVVDKAVTLTAAGGITVMARTDGSSFGLSDGAVLEGVTVEMGDVADAVVRLDDGATVTGCRFEGVSENAGVVAGCAVEGAGGATDITVADSTFRNIHTPGRFERCTGAISGNEADGTAGWILGGASDMVVQDNTFGENELDIAVVASDGNATNHYAQRTAKLSRENDGAAVRNELASVEAAGGQLIVRRNTGDYDLAAALAEVNANETVALAADITAEPFQVPRGVTLDGQSHTITDSSRGDEAFITMDANAVVQNAVVDVDGRATYGVVFEDVDGGQLRSVEVQGGTGAPVLVKDSRYVLVVDSALAPVGDEARASIECMMGEGGTIPILIVDGVEFAEDVCQIWMDGDTFEAAQARLTGADGAVPSDEAVRDALRDCIQNREYPDVDVGVEIEDGGSFHAALGCSGGTLCPTAGYPDVDRAQWYHDAADWAVSTGAMTGYTDGSGRFGIGDALTRAQLAQVLYNQAGRPEVGGKAGFSDCSATAWYADAVAWASSEGLMTGYAGTDNFGPDDSLTREMLAVVFWRMEGEPEGAGDLATFPDGDKASDWATDALSWAVGTGLMRGYDSTGELAPGGVTAREQAATFFMRSAGADAE